ncbi:MAG TPA: DNA-directed RNA polymerase subunit K [Candidatus Woesearchaeota archaeon]|nr:DNA-directed RNA polymerase subunit K [Candidatus Woesearchaeota archaeon]
MRYTRFEKARILGARALQLSMGAPMLLKLSEKQLQELKYNVNEIAKLEFEKGLLPIKVKTL